MDDRRPDDRRTDRRDEILRALVEEHIQTGEPVSSRRILERTGLDVSGATVRNELAGLDRDGYAVQPHTSAGRVPTSKAYRYYVDHLSPSKLRVNTQQRISSFFSSVHLELGRLLKATTELLTDITHFPAVAIGPGPFGEEIKAAHLVQMGAKTVLMVTVTDTGRVSQELCRLDTAVTTPEVEEAEQMLAAVAIGADLGSVGADAFSEFDIPGPVRSVVHAALEAMGRAARQSSDIYVGGTRQMATVWDNLSTVHRVLEVLEREAMLLSMLGGAGTTIHLGDERPDTEGVDMAVVSTSFEAGAAEGRVGVIGPMRMDYKEVISTVEGVSRELGDRMND